MKWGKFSGIWTPNTSQVLHGFVLFWNKRFKRVLGTWWSFLTQKNLQTDVFSFAQICFLNRKKWKQTADYYAAEGQKCWKFSECLSK